VSAHDRFWALPRSALLGLLSAILAYASCTQAHESRPAYLELKVVDSFWAVMTRGLSVQVKKAAVPNAPTKKQRKRPGYISDRLSVVA
jgi:hypothetical protein